VTSSPVTTSKWVWWIFLLVAPALGFLLLGIGARALPVGLVLTAIPIFVTWRLLGTRWRTRAIVRILYVLLAAATVVLAFTDPSTPIAMYIPEWLGSILGFYFVAAPLLLAGCVLFELHRVSLNT
jgi:hypothetical protein